MEYSDFHNLEKLLEQESVIIDLAIVYPNEVRKWIALQRRNGKYCPLSRGVLKMIIYYERDNKVFVKNLETLTWDTEWKSQRKT